MFDLLLNLDFFKEIFAVPKLTDQNQIQMIQCGATREYISRRLILHINTCYQV